MKPIKCAGCDQVFTHEGVTNNDNTGRLWHSRECKALSLAVSKSQLKRLTLQFKGRA